MDLRSRDDDQGYIPVANRRETVWGAAITFQILATTAVALRAYVRAIVLRRIGTDDVLVFLAWAAVFAGSTIVILSVDVGLGQHINSLSFSELEDFFLYFYLIYGLYSISTTLVKLSLLFQYLQLIREGRWRYACIAITVITALWGFAYSFMALFPCFPVRAYWNWSIADANCYGFGDMQKHPFVDMYVSHAATNAVLDITILLVPAPFLVKRAMSKREIWSVVGLATLGLVVILTCIWRLAIVAANQAGWKGDLPAYAVPDFTWQAPISVILGCLEAEVAIIACSIPIFWAIVENRILQIFVQNEVEVTEICLEQASSKSDTGSEAGLAASNQWSPPRTSQQKGTFYDEVIERLDPSPANFESRIRTFGDGADLAIYR